MLHLFFPKGLKPLLFNLGGQAVEARPVNVGRLKRTEGIASFVADRITLRLPLSLCHSCERGKMGRNWRRRFEYAELTAFHGEAACDYCREETAVGLFFAENEAYWQQHMAAQRSVDETRKRERQLYDKDRRYLIGT